MVKHLLLIATCLFQIVFIASCDQQIKNGSDGIIRLGMPFADANTILTNHFGAGDKYRDTKEAPPDKDYFDFLIDKTGEKILIITISPKGEKGKIIDITLHAGSKFGKAYDKSFRVREIDINDL